MRPVTGRPRTRRCCLLLLALLLSSATAVQQRVLLARPLPDRCLNTGSGLRILADSRGYVCPRDDMNYLTGCCRDGKRFSCEGCKLSDKCCAEYEHCVSCCLGPEHQAEKLFATTPRSAKNPSAGMWTSAWEYCRGVCRTHSQSTSHENAYISSRHHCFSRLGRPMLSEPVPENALVGVIVVMGAAGVSCDEACAKRNEECSAPHFVHLNSCDRLREQVGCEAGCAYGRMPGGSAPGYMDTSAPKASRPALCFALHPGNSANITCAGKDQHARRICPCKLKQLRK